MFRPIRNQTAAHAHAQKGDKCPLRRNFTLKLCVSQNSNLKALKSYFEKYCYCNFKARFIKTN